MGDAVARLREVVGDAHVLVGADLRASYETDWTRRFHGAAAAVVRPANTDEVAAVLRACADEGLSVVPQGGNTGLVGGSVPRGGEVVVSLRRLTSLDPVDPASGPVTAGAGATLRSVQEHALAAGFEVGIDFAARDSATIGGIVATNAGGARVLRYGMTSEQIVGVEAVLADGSVIRRLSGLVKDNSGYDLVSLLIGSEGTLGIVTAARLRLFPRLAHRTTALIALDSSAAAVDALAQLKQLVEGLEAADIFYARGLELVCRHLSARPPLDGTYDVYLVVDVAGRSWAEDSLVTALGAISCVRDAAVASDVAGRQRLWRYREGHTEAIAAAGVPIKLDVAVPVGRLPDLVDVLEEVVHGSAPGSTLVLFGHLGEGNLHVNLLGVPDAAARDVADQVLRTVTEFGGGIGGEHGIGVSKAPWLGLSRSPDEIAAMRAIRRAIDPRRMLNPGAVLQAP